MDSRRNAVWMLYIRAHEQTPVRRIAAGSYLLRFALGLDWDADIRKFRRNLEFYQAGSSFVFCSNLGFASPWSRWSIAPTSLKRPRYAPYLFSQIRLCVEISVFRSFPSSKS